MNHNVQHKSLTTVFFVLLLSLNKRGIDLEMVSGKKKEKKHKSNTNHKVELKKLYFFFLIGTQARVAAVDNLRVVWVENSKRFPWEFLGISSSQKQ